MKILFRLIGGLFTLILILVVGLLIFSATFDVNQYRTEIETAIEEQTGHSVQLAGPIELLVFPRLQISTNNIKLLDPMRAGEYLMTVDNIYADMDTLSLLTGHIQIDSIRLKNPDLHLISDKSGRSNWETDALAEAAEAAKAEPAAQQTANTKEDGYFSAMQLQIDKISVQNAKLVWDDREQDTIIKLSDVNLDMGLPQDGVPVDVRVNGVLSSSDLNKALDKTGVLKFDLSGRLTSRMAMEEMDIQDLRLQADYAMDTPQHLKLNLSGHLTGRLAQQQINLEDLRLQADYPMGAQQHLPIDLLGDLALDLGKQQAQMTIQRIELAGLQASGDMQINGFDSAMRMAGTVQSNTFNLREVLDTLDVDLPKFNDGQVMSAVQFKGQWQGDQQSMNLREWVVRMDDSQLKLTGALSLDAQQTNDLNIQIDQIKIDRYMPAASAGGGEAKQSSPANETSEAIDLRQLPKLNLQMAIGLASWQKTESKQVRIRIAVDAPKIQAELAGNVFSGHIQTQLNAQSAANTNHQQLDWQLQGQAKTLAVEQILAASEQDLVMRGRISAGLKLGGRLAMQDGADDTLRRSLNGQAQVSLQQARLNNPRLAQTIEKVLAFLGSREAATAGEEIIIKTSEANFDIRNGIADNQDLQLNIPSLSGTGKGQIDLVRERMNYTLLLQVSNRDDWPAIPILITGPWDDLSYRPQLDQTIIKKAKDELKEKVTGKREDIKERVNEEVDRLKEKVNEKLRGLLKF